MFGAGKNMHRVYGVLFYIAAIWVVYGRKEVLPKRVTKFYNGTRQPGGLKAEKRDPKVAFDYNTMLHAQVIKGGTMAAGAKALPAQ